MIGKSLDAVGGRREYGGGGRGHGDGTEREQAVTDIRGHCTASPIQPDKVTVMFI